MRFMLPGLLLIHCLGAEPPRNPPASYPAEIAGTARNAKISGVVVSERLTVYCLNVPDWGQREGQRVTVKGLVEFTEEFAAPKKGEISQGTEGGVFVMRKCELK